MEHFRFQTQTSIRNICARLEEDLFTKGRHSACSLRMMKTCEVILDHLIQKNMGRRVKSISFRSFGAMECGCESGCEVLDPGTTFQGANCFPLAYFSFAGPKSCEEYLNQASDTSREENKSNSTSSPDH